MAVALRKWGNSTGVLLHKGVIKGLNAEKGEALYASVKDKKTFILSKKEVKRVVNHETNISQWGNSLGIRIPKAVLEELDMKIGDKIVVEITNKGQAIFKKIEQSPEAIAFGVDLKLNDGTVLKAGTDATPYLDISYIGCPTESSVIHSRDE